MHILYSSCSCFCHGYCAPWANFSFLGLNTCLPNIGLAMAGADQAGSAVSLSIQRLIAFYGQSGMLTQQYLMCSCYADIASVRCTCVASNKLNVHICLIRLHMSYVTICVAICHTML